MAYFMIETSEDGDVYLTEYTKEELEKNLQMELEDGYADSKSNRFHAQLDRQWIELQARAGRYLIKGELIVPRQVQVVTKVEVD